MSMMDGSKTFPVFEVVVGAFGTIFRIQSDPFRIFENIHLYASLPEHGFITVGARYIANDDAIKLAHIQQRGADIARTQRSKYSRFAEIYTACIPDRRSLTMIVGMILLNERVVTFTHDFARSIVDNYSANGATTLVIAFLRQKNC